MFDEIATGLHNSLNPRPELRAGEDDDLPVNDSRYIQDLAIERGQGIMGLLIYLSLNNAPHETI